MKTTICLRVSISAVGGWALAGRLASSGLSKFGLKVLISWSKSKLGYSLSNSARWVRLNPFKASSTILSLLFEVGRHSVVFSKNGFGLFNCQTAIRPCNKKKLYHKYIFLLAESFKALFEEEDQITLATINLAQAFGGLPVEIPPLTISRQIMKKVCVSVGEIIDELSIIEDEGQDYGGREAAGKLQNPDLLNLDLNFCGSILLDPQRYLGNGHYLAHSPPSFTKEPIASSVTRETFNSLIRVEFNFEIRGIQTYHSAKVIKRKY